MRRRVEPAEDDLSSKSVYWDGREGKSVAAVRLEELFWILRVGLV